jgi:hypothetical protein
LGRTGLTHAEGSATASKQNNRFDGISIWQPEDSPGLKIVQ